MQILIVGKSKSGKSRLANWLKDKFEDEGVAVSLGDDSPSESMGLPIDTVIGIKVIDNSVEK